MMNLQQITTSILGAIRKIGIDARSLNDDVVNVDGIATTASSNASTAIAKTNSLTMFAGAVLVPFESRILPGVGLFSNNSLANKTVVAEPVTKNSLLNDGFHFIEPRRISNAAQIYDTLSSALASNIAIGDIIQTQGRTVQGDGGDAYYRSVAVNPNNGRAWRSVDNSFFLEMDMGMTREMRPEQFGPITGTDHLVDTATIQAMLDGHDDLTPCVFEKNPLYMIQAEYKAGASLKCSSDSIELVWRGNSFWKVKDGADGYDALFGLNINDGEFMNRNYPIDGWRFINPQVDHNSQNCPITPSPEGTTDTSRREFARGRYTFTGHRSLRPIHNFLVLGGIIKNNDSVVSIYVNDLTYQTGEENNPKPVRHRNLYVIGTRFECMLNSVGDYDMSTINLGGYNVKIKDCNFAGKSWESSPRTAIEPHGSPLQVTGNSITKYQVGVNITAMSMAGDTEFMMDCVNNQIEVSGTGIYLWSGKMKGNQVHTLGATDMNVSSNTIYLRWKKAGIGKPRMTAIGSSFFDLPVENVKILDNLIIYDEELKRWTPNKIYAVGDKFIAKDPVSVKDTEYLVVTNGISGSSFTTSESQKYTNVAPAVILLDSQSGGSNYNVTHAVIEFSGTSVSSKAIRNLEVDNNKIVNAPLRVWYSYKFKIRNGSFSGNKLYNCGTSSNTVAELYKYLVTIRHDNEGSTFLLENNSVYTDGRKTTGIFWFDGISGSICVGENNRVFGGNLDNFANKVENSCPVVDSYGESSIPSGIIPWNSTRKDGLFYRWDIRKEAGN